MKTGKNLWSCKYWLPAIALLLSACSGTPANSNKNPEHRPPVWQQLEQPFHVTCLVYHRFGDARYPSTNTSTEAFEAHLKHLKSKGFTAYTVSELLDDTAALAGPGKKVLITIDDGFASVMDNGLPLLEKHHMRATLFVNTHSVGGNDYLNWEQLKTLHEKGVEIGNHTHRHEYFVNLPQNKRASVFEEDLLKAESLFEEHLGFVPKIYAYTYGEFTPDMVAVLKKHHYRIAFAQNSGVLSNHTHPYAVPRFPVAGAHVNMEQFSSKTAMLPLEVTPADQLPVLVQAGETVTLTAKMINAELSGPFNCFIAGNPAPDALKREGDTLTITVKVPPDNRRTLVTVTTRDKEGRWLWYSRVLIKASP